jgi:hypothetical protein
MAQPKYRISNFTKDNVYWLNNSLPIKVGNSNVICSAFNSKKLYDNSNIASLTNILNIYGISETTGTLSITKKVFMIDGLGNIYMIDPTNTYYGLIHTSIDGAGVERSMYPDIMISPKGTILYTTAGFLGRASLFRATSASSTTLVVSGTDFEALGFGSGTGVNKVYNITKRAEYTLTGSSGTTLSFDTQSPAPEDGDYFYAFQDNYSAMQLVDSTSSPDSHFSGQGLPMYWDRQIRSLDDRTFILNGNYLAMLSYDETTLTDDYQELPLSTQATCMGVNNDLILIGGYVNNGGGKLMLYDGYSSYFKSIISTSSIPKSIVPYKSGWIVIFIDGEIRYTDGVDYKILSILPDRDIRKTSITIYGNSCLTMNDMLFISCVNSESSVLTTDKSLRAKSGIHIYDIKNDVWSFTRAIDTSGLTALAPMALKIINSSTNIPQIYYGKNKTIGYIDTNDNNTKKDIFLVITLPKKEAIRLIDLNFGFSYNGDFNYLQNSDTTATVSVSACDGRNGLFAHNKADATSTKTNIVPDIYKGRAFINQEIQIINTTGGTMVNGDEYTYITAIENAGENNESWTVESLTSNFANDQSINTLGFVKGETKEITYSTINKDNTFRINDFYGDKLYLHIRIDGALDLYGINIQ